MHRDEEGAQRLDAPVTEAISGSCFPGVRILMFVVYLVPRALILSFIHRLVAPTTCSLTTCSLTTCLVCRFYAEESGLDCVGFMRRIWHSVCRFYAWKTTPDHRFLWITLAAAIA